MRKLFSWVVTVYFIITVSIGLSFNPRNQETEVEINCVPFKLKCSPYVSGKQIINNEAQYFKILTSAKNSNCYSYSLPKVDFSKYSLLGYRTSVGGCKEPEVTYRILKTGEKVVMKVHVKILGICKPGNYVDVWCLIPKVKLDSNIEIQVTKDHLDNDGNIYKSTTF